MAAGIGVAIAAAMSYWHPLAASFVAYDLYGIKLRNGVLQVFHGTRDIVSSPSTPSAPVQRVGWREPRPGWSAEETAGLGGMDLHVTVGLWPPFGQTASVRVESQSQSFNAQPAFAVPRDNRTFEYRATSAWLLAGLLALPLFPLARSWLRDQPPGRCRACGYDLRASPDRCPECGALVPSHGTPGEG